jgi:hypothetical protein
MTIEVIIEAFMWIFAFCVTLYVLITVLFKMGDR